MITKTFLFQAIEFSQKAIQFSISIDCLHTVKSQNSSISNYSE